MRSLKLFPFSLTSAIVFNSNSLLAPMVGVPSAVGCRMWCLRLIRAGKQNSILFQDILNRCQRNGTRKLLHIVSIHRDLNRIVLRSKLNFKNSVLTTHSTWLVGSGSKKSSHYIQFGGSGALVRAHHVSSRFHAIPSPSN